MPTTMPSLRYCALTQRRGCSRDFGSLKRQRDSSFEQDFLDRSPDDSVAFRLTRLCHRSASVQLGALMNLNSAGEIEGELVDAVAELLRHREPEIQQLAATILGRCSTVPRSIHDELGILAEDGPSALRRAAISALRPGFENDGDVVDVLTDVLRRCDPSTAAVCIKTLLKYDSHPEHLIDVLLKSLGSMVSSGSGDLRLGVELLQRVHRDPSSALQQYFSDDPTALAILDEQMSEAE